MSKHYVIGKVSVLLLKISARLHGSVNRLSKTICMKIWKRLLLELNATSIVWVRLLQLRRMRKEKHLALSNDWLAKHGVTRYAKMRALQTLEQRGLIVVTQSAGRSPRIVIIPRRERRRPAKNSVTEPLRCVA